MPHTAFAQVAKCIYENCQKGCPSFQGFKGSKTFGFRFEELLEVSDLDGFKGFAFYLFLLLKCLKINENRQKGCSEMVSEGFRGVKGV